MNPEDSGAAKPGAQVPSSPFVSQNRIVMPTPPKPHSELIHPITGDNSAPTSVKPDIPKTEAPKQEPKEANIFSHLDKAQEEGNLTKFEDRKSFNFGLAFAWVVAFLSILGTLYFWWLNRNLSDDLADKKAKNAAVVAQLESPGNIETEKEAINFKASVAALNSAKQSRNAKATFLTDFFTKIDNDVKINSLSVSSDGSLSIAGVTKSYRTIADQVMALKSWPVLSSVDLTSSSFGSGATNAKEAAKFSITAKVKDASLAATAKSSTTTTTGGAK